MSNINNFANTHLKRDEFESNLSVPEISGYHVNTPIKIYEMSPHFVCLKASPKIPLGPVPLDQVWIQAGRKGMSMPA